MTDSQTLNKTPLNDRHRRLGARMVPFGGWDMPLTYEGQLAEHRAVRETVGLFDVSHMGQVRFSGRRALAFLAELIPSNLWKITDGKSLYTCLTNDEGGVVDDFIVTRVSPYEAFAVVNAATRESDVQWIHRQRIERGFEDVEVIDESGDWAMIAVQGPKALALLNELLPGTDWTTTPGFTMHAIENGGEELLVSRTGYTGENGAEILCPPELAEDLWMRAMDLGAAPCGLAARDSLRLEMGYPLYGQDLAADISPVEGGIGWTVHLKKKEDFPGRETIHAHKAEGAPRKRIGLRVDSRRPIRHGDAVAAGGREIGTVTSGGFSPVLQKGIALAIVQSDFAGREELTLVSRGKETTAQVTKPPFVTVNSRQVK